LCVALIVIINVDHCSHKIHMVMFCSGVGRAYSSGCIWLSDCPLQELCHARISIQHFTTWLWDSHLHQLLWLWLY